MAAKQSVNFDSGFEMIVQLLKTLQEIQLEKKESDSEYNPSQDIELTLRRKLYNIAMVHNSYVWCGNDKNILLEACNQVLSALNETKFITSHNEYEMVKVSGYSINCLIYDVVSKPISLNLPLSRFLAELYTRFGNSKFATKEIPEVKIETVEETLCLLTFISELDAGVLRSHEYGILEKQISTYRGGFSYYVNFVPDITILQIAAANTKSNEFLIYLLHKFDLISWANGAMVTSVENYQDFMEKTVKNIDAFLKLLIVIISERHMGDENIEITDYQKFRRNVIHYLCIKPMTHSELHEAIFGGEYENKFEYKDNERSLYKEMNEEIDPILEQVAIKKEFKKTIFYNLKDECYSEVNLFSHHFTKEEKSDVETAILARQKQYKCCPPPKLQQLSIQINGIVDILQCDLLMRIIHNVFEQSLDPACQTFSESHVQKVSQ